MPESSDTSALRDRVKLGLLRELYRQGRITEAQLVQLLQLQQRR